MIRTPLNNAVLQSDLDVAGFELLNFDAGSGLPVGGTTGQSLTKNSNVDFDVEWNTVSSSNALIGINVKDAPYNAAGDGVTDDTVAIQTAMNDLISTTQGGVLFFPNGVYLCNGAYDATTNSILKIPYNNGAVTTKTIMLQGQAPATPYGAGHESGAVIKTTRNDGTGLHPALLAAYSPQGYPSDDLTGDYFNYTMVQIRNLGFRVVDNPTLCAVRLDTADYAVVEDVSIFGGGSQPTHSLAVGLWMPVGGAGGRSYVRNVQITGFYTGLIFSEHFLGHNVVLITCIVAVGLTTGYQPAELNFQTYWCPTHVSQYGNHLPVKFIGRLEDGDPSAAPSWQLVVSHVNDPSNTIYGVMDYIRVREPERFHGNDLILNGATNLQLRNLYTSSYHWIKVGTDARFTPVSGGVKLEARNTSTGLWVEAARWTNP